MWSPPEHNPLGLRPAKIRISAGGNLDPSLRAARAFLSSGTLCSPPGLLFYASKEEDGVDFVTALIRPSQDEKVRSDLHICNIPESVISFNCGSVVLLLYVNRKFARKQRVLRVWISK